MNMFVLSLRNSPQGQGPFVCFYIHTYIHIDIYIYICRKRERSRERERHIVMCIYIYIYMRVGRILRPVLTNSRRQEFRARGRSACLSVYLCLRMSNDIYAWPSMSMSVSVRPSIRLSIHPSIYACLHCAGVTFGCTGEQRCLKVFLYRLPQRSQIQFRLPLTGPSHLESTI